MTKMEMVGGMQSNTEKVWFRCTRCHHMSLITVMPAEKTNGNGADVQNAKPYNPQESFLVGDSIFHSEWNDFGKVLSKTRTSDGSHAIVVHFEKQGERTLVEEVAETLESITQETIPQ